VVIDIDRVQVSYENLSRLIRDLRAMGLTNILTGRPRRSLSKAEWKAAQAAFTAARQADRTTETFEILHFAGWTAPEPAKG